MTEDGVTLKEYFEAILDEQRRANIVAEQEREKSATTLADAMAQAIHEGDERLREHISQQIAQIEAALAAAQRETLIRYDASDKAISKAEGANEKRFESVNEFRAQLSEQTAQFIPREVAETQFADMNKRIGSNTDAITTMVGKAAGVSATVGYIITAATVVISFVVVIANGGL